MSDQPTTAASDGARTASLERVTSESSIRVELNLDGTGQHSISTSVPFYDHMLTALSKHSLIDLTVITAYFSAFSLFRFVYKLWVLGHNLDPKAPVRVAPFMPAVFGTKQIANFTVTSLPRLGSVYMGIFALGVVGLTVWHLWRGRRDAVRAMRGA